MQITDLWWFLGGIAIWVLARKCILPRTEKIHISDKAIGVAISSFSLLVLFWTLHVNLHVISVVEESGNMTSDSISSIANSAEHFVI
jgi:hypothetical protein